VLHHRRCITQSDAPLAARLHVPAAERKHARRRARERARTRRQTRLSRPSHTDERARALISPYTFVGVPMTFALASRRERGVPK
jgi:hypothetical protein